jgi:outer membrane receptor for ferrienterochelin and colicins
MPTRFMSRPFPALAVHLAAALCCAAGAQATDTKSGADGDVQTIVVTASRYAMLALDAPASLSVVQRREIEARGADNVLEAVRLESGLALQGRAVGGRKALGLRGLDARHTLMLLDGQRIGASDGVVGASDFQYDWLSSAEIERIEVVRGPLSVLYGSEALGGVVNVVTRQPGAAWSFGALAEGSRADGGRGGDGWRAQASAMGPLGGGLALRAGVSASGAEPVAVPGEPRLSELEGRDKREGWLGVHGQFGAHRLRLDRREGRETRESLTRERSGQRRWHQTLNDLERRTSALSWEARWVAHGADAVADAPESQLRVYESMLDVRNRRTAGVPPNVPQRLEDRVLDGQLRWPLKAQDWLVGFERRRESLADPGLPAGRSSADHEAVFVQNEARLSSTFTLTAGLRRDDHSFYGGHWSPRIYGVWKLAPGWTLKGGASSGFKSPNLKQVVPGSRAEGPNTVIGNPALEPESSDGVELGLGWAVGARQVQAVLFAQRVRDLIELRLVTAGPAPGTGTYVYENLARARLRGLEATWAEPLATGVTLGAAYTYLDARDGNDRRLDRRPRHSAMLRLDARRGAWQGGVHAEHTGEQRLPVATVGAPSQPVPATTLFGAYAGRTLPAGLELRLGVRNLGNLRLADESPLFTQAEAPRTWRLSLQGRW